MAGGDSTGYGMSKETTNGLHGAIKFGSWIVGTIFFISIFHWLFMSPIERAKNVALNDYQLFDILKTPLMATIINEGKTLNGDGEKAQVFEYKFKGYMTNSVYRTTLSRRAQFEDCAGCIGDWEAGMIDSPEFDGKFIPLSEFIIQMVHSKNEEDSSYRTRENKNLMIWHSYDCTWYVEPTKDGMYYSITANYNDLDYEAYVPIIDDKVNKVK